MCPPNMYATNAGAYEYKTLLVKTSETVDDEEERRKETKTASDLDATVYESCMHTVTWQSLKAISISLHLGVDLMP